MTPEQIEARERIYALKMTELTEADAIELANLDKIEELDYHPVFEIFRRNKPIIVEAHIAHVREVTATPGNGLTNRQRRKLYHDTVKSGPT